MDALEIMSNLDRVIPYYQPIFSADEHKIAGYEVLGRYMDGEKAKSLGGFFHDEDTPDEYRHEVEDVILKKALDDYTAEKQKSFLFINRQVSGLLEDYGESFLAIIESYTDKGVTLDKIVLEISAAEYSASLDNVLRYYKTLGIRLAVDHLGEAEGDIRHFASYSPDILKVSLQALRKDAGDQTYKNIVYSLSMFARKIGASLLFETVEVEYQLQYAWKNGGRYYQGFYLAEPSPVFVNPDQLKAMLREKCSQFISYEKQALNSVYTLADKIEMELDTILSKSKSASKEKLLEEIGQHFDGMCFRLYICDENGFELTPNYFKKEGDWVFQPEYFDKNWSWRPYFLENILRMRKNGGGLISDLYSDIETGETIRTFSCPIRDNEYLFFDIPYEFLYDQEGLLY
ncbi:MULTISPECIES: EAL-associated domain-containing protein [Bacillaceae]|uniref:Diguanylate phosphodiesterase n=1 Tax=Domibacillus aminovorans TaxID=29332 RepID=A0A177KKF1_9BACI|nr:MULTISPECIES: EAL-associated domain-containing protein [Bacillaceae]OAH53624.1 diguanylate phosphodiesterase [Domibacillus aminovorans]